MLKRGLTSSDGFVVGNGLKQADELATNFYKMAQKTAVWLVI
jgi:hypothetical protein